MAKFVYIYNKKTSNWESETSKIKKVLGRFHTDPFLKTSNHEMLWSSTSKGLKIDGWNLLTGNFSTDEHQFTFRLSVEPEAIKLTPDIVASRTIWYFVDDKRIIVSSSQRALIAILGDLALNHQAISWMLCCGNIGPNSWDQRINPVIQGEEVRISKNDLIITRKPKEYLSDDKSLNTCFLNVFNTWNKNLSAGITLSGGYDSRAVGYMLSKHKTYPNAYTWGTKTSYHSAGTDAFIASEIAKTLGLSFQFIPLDNKMKSKRRLEAFVAESEGRIDHINTFINGFEFWEQLKKEQHTIIRADEAFGWLKVGDELDVRVSLDINNPQDYFSINQAFLIGKIEPPKWPQSFQRKTNETLESWRDRLYREYRIPFILAALQEPMLSFVEIVNPLLHSEFVTWSKNQPDNNRTDKKKYKQLVRKWLNAPTATIPAIPEVQTVLSEKQIVDDIKAQLKKTNRFYSFNKDMIDHFCDSLQTAKKLNSENRWIRLIKNLIPFKIKKLIRKYQGGYSIGGNRIAFRAYIVLKMLEIIENDLE